MNMRVTVLSSLLALALLGVWGCQRWSRLTAHLKPILKWKVSQ
jgi:hypothetical protein